MTKRPVVGKKYIIIKNISGHGFKIGEVVEILDDQYIFFIAKSIETSKFYYITGRELKPYNINSEK